MRPTGGSRFESVHVCDSSGIWVPDIMQLRCSRAECPPAPNVLYSTMSGYVD